MLIMQQNMLMSALFVSVILGAAPLKAELVVSPPPTPAIAPNISQPNPYTLLLPVRPRVRVRCEQDRLLTDTSPCGKETAEPILLTPKKLMRCEQDRLLTDTRPCER